MGARERPLGVTVLGFLGILGGLLVVLIGLGLAVAIIAELPIAGGFARELIGGLGIGIGLFTALIGLTIMFINWKFLHGSYLAWIIVLALNVISLLGSFPLLLSGLQVPFLLFLFVLPPLANIIVIIYLLQPGVRGYFQGKPKELPPPPPPPPAI